MSFWRRNEPYRSGDRVFTILRQPDVAVLLTCDEPSRWSVMIFDLREKQAVLKAQRRGSVSEAKRFGIGQVEAMYRMVEPNVQWHEAVFRSNMLQV